MASERKLTVVLAGDAKGLNRALGSASASTGKFGSKLGGLGGKAKLAMAGAATAVVAFGKSSVDAFMEAEQSQAQLSAAYDKFPALANGNIGALRALNSELAKKTKFDDDATASGQAVLAQFGLNQKQLEQLTPLMQDYAARTGKDLPTAAKDLGKAVLGQGKALKGIGVQFKDTGSAAGNFEQLMGGLRTQVGGFATKEGATTAGKVAIMKNQFGELQETVGSKLIPVLSKLLAWGLDWGTWLGEHKPVLIALGAVVGTVLVGAFTAWAVSATTAAVATIAAAAPVLLVVGAIGLLVAGIVLLVKNWGWVKEKAGQALGFIKDKAGAVVDWVVDKFGFITEIPGKIIDSLAHFGSKFARPFLWAFDQIARLWNNTIGSLSFRIPGWVPGIGGKGFDVPDLPRITGLAEGGIVKARPGGGLFNIGEAGHDEAVIPLDGRHGLGGTVIHNHFTVAPGQEAEAGRVLVRYLDSYFKSGGTSTKLVTSP